MANMQGRTGAVAVVVRTLAAGLLAGCATLSAPPDWVKKGARVEAREIYGVGAVVGIHNAPLAWEAADNRARGQVVKILETYVALLMHDYAASTEVKSAGMAPPAEQQLVERAQKTVAMATLTGVEPVDRYYDEAANAYYVMVRWNAERVQEFVDRLPGLSEQAHKHLRRRAEELFRQLEQEAAKRERRDGAEGSR